MPNVALSAPEEWERQQGESAKAYDAFIRYRSMDVQIRSIRRLGAEMGRKDNKILFQWSRRWRWVERVKAWDSHCDLISREAQLGRIRQAGEARVDVVLHGLTAVRDRLVGRDEVVDKETGEIVSKGVTAIDVNTFDAKDIAQLGNMLGKLSSLAEEAAGVKDKDSGKPLEINVSFSMEPLQIGAQPGVIVQARPRTVETSETPLALDPAPDDTGDNTD